MFLDYILIPFLLFWQESSHPRDLPSGAVVGSPPANAGDMGLSPGPGRSRMLWSN